ncbi:MAG: UDP-N-acetylmuramate dehydrogenase [Epsilonproteobacteria bacterium]|nr:UDP-N-acetylmuramate dehydrogenase [Campylobacterota bacterium]
MRYKKIDFSKYSSFKMGGVFDVALLDRSVQNIDGYYLIGSCNNILIGNNPPPLITLDKEYDYIKIKDNKLIIGGATPSGKIVSFCKKHNIANFEFLSHLPGKLGGLVYMNAGLKEYEIFHSLIDLTLLSGTYKKEQIEYGYRQTNIKEPILEASFSLEYGYDLQKVAMFQKMRSNQPSTPSAGSCFKNPPNDYAGRLIEAVGLKGKQVGAMAFSEKHANFLVNYGDGVFEDAIALIEEAKTRVVQEFGVTLELEIIILDKAYPHWM